MSFGAAAAAGRGRRIAASASCVCESGAAFGECCAPVLDGEPAVSAEALMRSRFTAFSLGDGAHLLRSWHPATRPETLDLDDHVTWERLEVLAVDAGLATDLRGTVSFRARWCDIGSGERGVLAETSRFRRVHERWCYLDGIVAPD